MSRRVLLLINRSKPEVAKALDEVRRLIERNGAGGVGTTSRIVAEVDADSTALSRDVAKEADLVVVLGGDGTLMAQSRRCVAAGLDLPLLGVNFGKLGFMAEFDLDSLRLQADRLFNGSPLVVKERPVLRVTVERGLGSTGNGAGAAAIGDPSSAALSRTLALNDAVVTAGPPYRMIELGVSVDEEPGPTVTGDGLIVCTPIGSTAYNASAGGPIVSPDVPAMTINALAPHSLSFRPVVVGLESSIRVRVLRANDGTERSQGDLAELDDDGHSGSGTALVLDGQVPMSLRTGDAVLIRRHSRPIRFVKNPSRSYWSTLLTKMRWAAPPAARVR